MKPDRLRLRRVAPGSYEVVSRHHSIVGTIVRDGQPGRDDYPWTWMLTEARGALKTTGVTDTRRSALNHISVSWGGADPLDTEEFSVTAADLRLLVQVALGKLSTGYALAVMKQRRWLPRDAKAFLSAATEHSTRMVREER